MTPVLFAVAAAAGAVGRYAVARWFCTWHSLLGVNTAGAAVLGWILTRDVSEATMTIVGVGLCGSLTTFSSFALEVHRLGVRWGIGYGALTIVSVTAAASIAGTL